MTTSNESIPDIERTACTILAQAHPSNLELREWVRQITSDPTYAGLLPKDIDTAIWNESATYEHNNPYTPAADGAILMLAKDVVFFRRGGRTQGDVTTDIQGLGGPIMTVTTSLAASIADYVKAWRNIAAELSIELEAQS